MNEPPDVTRKKFSNSTGLQYDFTKKISINTTGPIYLVIKRQENENGFVNVSPFLIKKVIDAVCNGEVAECKKMKNGTLLIKTKNLSQANKLIKLTAMSSTIKTEVTVHNSFNFSKGVFYSSDLFGVPEEEILSNMSEQNVTEVKKILRMENETLKETGLLILTFSSISLPEHIYLGYQKIYLRPYIPPPLRCSNCLHYGHLHKFCNNNKICTNCGNINHINADANEKCNKPSCCINCKENNIEDCNHTAKDKKCPVFLKNKEIQAIRVLEKTSIKNAEKIYNKRHINKNNTYAGMINTNNTPAAPRPNPIKYDDISTTEQDNDFSTNSNPNKVMEINQTTPKQKSIIIARIDQAPTSSKSISTQGSTTILPRNTSNRLKAQLKYKFKTNSNPKTNRNSANDTPILNTCEDDETEMMQE